MKKRALGALSLLLAGVVLGALKASAGRDSGRERSARPEAVNPRSEAPTARDLELQRQALPQPRGERIDGQQPVMPLVAAPRR